MPLSSICLAAAASAPSCATAHAAHQILSFFPRRLKLTPRMPALLAAARDGVEGCNAGHGRHDERENHAAGNQAVEQVLQRRGDRGLGVQGVRQHRHQAGADARWKRDLLALRAAQTSKPRFRAGTKR